MVAFQTSKQLSSHYYKLRSIRVYSSDWLRVVPSGYDWFCGLFWSPHWSRAAWNSSGWFCSVFKVCWPFVVWADSNFYIMNSSVQKSLRWSLINPSSHIIYGPFHHWPADSVTFNWSLHTIPIINDYTIKTQRFYDYIWSFRFHNP